MSVFPIPVVKSPIREYEEGEDWQVKSHGYEAAFELDLKLFDAKTEDEWVNKNYSFDVDKALSEYEFDLPKGFFLDGVYRGCGLFIQVSSQRKPTLKQLNRVKTIIVSGLQEINKIYLAERIKYWNEE